MTIKHIIVHECDVCGAAERASRVCHLRIGPYKKMDLCHHCRDSVERFIERLKPGKPEEYSED